MIISQDEINSRLETAEEKISEHENHSKIKQMGTKTAAGGGGGRGGDQRSSNL